MYLRNPGAFGDSTNLGFVGEFGVKDRAGVLKGYAKNAVKEGKV